MPIVVIGLSHRTCPVELRERFAFPELKIPEAIQKLRTEGVAEEAVILSTCNRVEIYAASASASRDTLEALQGLERVSGSARAGSVNLHAVTGGKNDRFLRHAFRPQLLDRLRNFQLGKRESFPQFDRARAMAQTDDNYGHLKKLMVNRRHQIHAPER